MYIQVKDFLKEEIVAIFQEKIEASDYKVFNSFGDNRGRFLTPFCDWEMSLEFGSLISIHGKRKNPAIVEDSGGVMTLVVKLDFFSHFVAIEMVKEVSKPSAEGLYPFHDYKVKSATFVLLDMRRNSERFVRGLRQDIPLLDGTEGFFPKDIFKNFLI